MYYKRFQTNDLTTALAKDIISTEQMGKILNFYENDTFILSDSEAVSDLKSVIPDIVEEYRDGLFHCKVRTWPQFKAQCLLFAQRDPCHFQYIREEDGGPLFFYHVDTYSFRLA